MADNYSVIASGTTPSRSAQIGSSLGHGFGQALGGIVGQNIAERRQAKQLNPFREALAGTIPQGQPLTPQQQMIAAAVQDPRMFAQLAQNAQGAYNLAGQFAPQAPTTAYQREFVVRHDSELAKRFELNLAEGDTATVKLNYDQQGNMLPGVEIEQFSRAPAASGDGTDNPFGNSLAGRSLAYMANLAPRFAKGETTDDEDRILLAAITNYRQPERYTDPDTGLTVERRNEVPDYVKRAMQQRGYSIGHEGIMGPVGGDPVQLARQPSQQAQMQHGAIAQSMPTIPADALPEPLSRDLGTIYEVIATGDVMGPRAAAVRQAYRFGIGNGQKEQEAAVDVSGVRERIVKALQQNPRYAEGEAQRLLGNINIEPSALRSTDSALSQVVGIDRILQRVEAEMREVVQAKRALVSGETRQHAMDTLAAVDYWRKTLLPPMVKPQQLEEYARTAVPGQRVLIEYSPQNRIIAHVFNDEQRAAAFAQTAEKGTRVVVNGVLYEVE